MALGFPRKRPASQPNPDIWGRLGPLGVVEVTVAQPSLGLGAQMTMRLSNGQTVQAFGGDIEQCLRHAEAGLRKHGPERALPATPEPLRRTGKALGFRSWKLEGYKLLSANPGYGDWKIGEPTEATCRTSGVGLTLAQAQHAIFNFAKTPNQIRQEAGMPETGHEAPHPDCQCGLYALHAPEFMSRWHSGEPLMVHGAVLGWGRMEVHAEGWRAQYAQPVMLAFDGDQQSYNHCQRVRAMGDELGLPVAEWPDFEREARKLAEPVPTELRPERPANPFAGQVGQVARIGFPSMRVMMPTKYMCACGCLYDPHQSPGKCPNCCNIPGP